MLHIYILYILCVISRNMCLSLNVRKNNFTGVEIHDFLLKVIATTTATRTDEKLGKTYFGCDKTHITISD